jgi:streptogramin lyase
VSSIAIDSEGNKWFGTYGGGVSKFDDNIWTTYKTTNGLVSNFVNSITIDAQGNKWFGTVSGVSKFDGSTWTTYTSSNGLVTNDVISIAIDAQGNIWFGTYGGGVSKFDGISWTTYTKSNGLINNYIQFIAIDKQGNKWFGTDGGISKLTDIATSIRTDERSNNIAIYPVPAQNNIFIKTKGQDGNIQIVDISGKCVAHKQIAGNLNEIDISALKQGVYTLKFISIDGIFTNKLIKE